MNIIKIGLVLLIIAIMLFFFGGTIMGIITDLVRAFSSMGNGISGIHLG